MQFLNNLFSVNQLQRDSNAIHAEIALLADSVIYRAHFPGQPVTPGVCIIQIAVELASVSLERKLIMTGVRNAKFLNIIDPLATPVVLYDIAVAEQPDSGCKLTVTVSTPEGTVCSKLSLICSESL